MVSKSTRPIGVNTGITLGLLVAMLGAGVTCAVLFVRWSNEDSAWKARVDMRLLGVESSVNTGNLPSMANRITRIEERLAEIDERLDVKTKSHFSADMMEIWCDRAEYANPGFVAPDPRDLPGMQ